jgi:thiazole/oxazole-forming peptide maturase SagD family component
MVELLKPKVVTFAYLNNENTLTFIGRYGEILLDQYIDEFLEILKHCNGVNTVQEIQSLVKNIELSLFEQIIEFLFQQELVVDSKELFIQFHQDSANPMPYRQQLSPKQINQIQLNFKSRHDLAITNIDFEFTEKSRLHDLLIGRKTIRDFLDVSIPLAKIAGLLEVMTKVDDSNMVPSAGGFYSLNIYLVKFKENDSLKRGLYQYISSKKGLICLQEEVSNPHFYRAFDSQEIVESCESIVIVAANISAVAEKYSNRAYRYCFIEAGHVAQNAYIYCNEKNIGIWEYGGFNDELLANQLELNYPKEVVLTTLILGVPDPNPKIPFQEKYALITALAYNLKEKYVGDDKLISDLQVRSYLHNDEVIPLVIAYTKFKSAGIELMGFARAYSISDAVIRAIAESVERYANGLLRFDAKCKPEQLHRKWLDPRLITPFHPDMYSIHTQFQPFDEQKEWEWVRGRRFLSGEDIYICVDNVFYPFKQKKLGRKPLYICSSNGASAHTDYTKAVEGGLRELIERDAIMVTWYNKKQVTSIPINYTSVDIRQRIARWVRKGWKIKLLDFTLDSLPVVVAVIWNELEYPCFVAGAGCEFDYKSAISKAFNEAEYMIVSWSKIKEEKILPQDVKSVHEHALLYFYPENLQKVQWLLEAPEKKPDFYEYTGSNIYTKFDPIVVDLQNAQDQKDLNVVMVLSERLIPINFGYALENYEHKRFSDLGLVWTREYPSFPHFFA